MLGVPVEQYREDYVILSPDKYEYDFVNIVTPTGSQIMFDETPLPRIDFEAIGEGEFSVLRLQIDDGVHHLWSVKPTQGECTSRTECEEFGEGWTKCVKPDGSGRDDPGVCEGPAPKFGTVVYGYDQYVSYGYPGGLNLRRINQCKNDAGCPEGASCCDADHITAGSCTSDEIGECFGQ